jgi:ATP-dependent helicase HrpA
LVALAKTLQQLSGTKMAAEDFDVSRLPNSLRMTYRPLDASGRPLGLGINLAALQAKFSESGRGAVAKVVEKVNSPIERDGLRAWDFDNLESSVESKHGGNLVRGFPALVAQPGGTVDIRLFSTESEQLRHHHKGVLRLVQAAIPSPAKYVESHLAQNEKLAIAGLPYSGFTAFIDDVILAVADRELQRIQADGLVFTRAEFERIRDAVSATVVESAFEVATLVTKIAGAARDANKAISSLNGFDFLAVLSAEKTHITELLSPNFVSGAGLERLPRILVYLQAIKLRIEKLSDNPARDFTAAQELDQAIGLYVFAGGKFPLEPDSSSKLVVARWLIEELRVSLFAQALGTSETVSVQRIKKALA